MFGHFRKTTIPDQFDTMSNNKYIDYLRNEEVIDNDVIFEVSESSDDGNTVRNDGSEDAYIPQSMYKIDDSTKSVNEDVVTERRVFDQNDLYEMIPAKIGIQGAYMRSGEATRKVYVRPPSRLEAKTAISYYFLLCKVL